MTKNTMLLLVLTILYFVFLVSKKVFFYLLIMANYFTEGINYIMIESIINKDKNILSFLQFKQ